MGTEKKTGASKIGGNLKKAFRVVELPKILDLLCAAPVLVCGLLVGMCGRLALVVMV